jgi:hypothetical protein
MSLLLWPIYYWILVASRIPRLSTKVSLLAMRHVTIQRWRRGPYHSETPCRATIATDADIARDVCNWVWTGCSRPDRADTATERVSNRLRWRNHLLWITWSWATSRSNCPTLQSMSRRLSRRCGNYIFEILKLRLKRKRSQYELLGILSRHTKIRFGCSIHRTKVICCDTKVRRLYITWTCIHTLINVANDWAVLYYIIFCTIVVFISVFFPTTQTLFRLCLSQAERAQRNDIQFNGF